MSEFFSRLFELLADERIRGVLTALLILLGGFLLSRIVSRRLHLGMMPAQQRMIVRRLGSTLIFVLSVAWALGVLGLDVGVLLGTAGVVTVAVGFAAQTSLSNLISGAFLMAERPFSIGDVIKVGDITGEVLSIDLLSVKLRTFDNLLVRLPNETVLKGNVTNMTYFPIRRLDMQIGVAYKEDVARVREVLFETARKNPVCLEEPSPLFIFLAYGDSALQFQFSIWSTRENFLELRNTMHEEIKRVFDEQGIEIPFPQRTLHVATPRVLGGERQGGTDQPEPADSP